MDSLIFICLGIGFLLVLYGVFFILNRPVRFTMYGQLKNYLTVEELGELEGTIEHLKEVFIVAHRIEAPTGKLLDSVKNNFTRGVTYTFLVSNSKDGTEIKSYYDIFEAIASKTELKTSNMREFVKIAKLDFEWDDYPYIFYKTAAQNGSFSTFGYMGIQMKRGIADQYELISPTLANKIIQLALSGIELQVKRITKVKNTFLL